jgi:hypothetical protein
MRRAIVTIAAVILAAGTLSAVAHGKTIYVDAHAAGTDNGTTWADAYKFLQDALTDANSSEKPVEIRVAQGIYQPDRSAAEPNGTGDREATFQLINGVMLKGGYAGFGQTDPNARDIALYETILSGDLDGNDVDVNDAWRLMEDANRAENSYHVLTGSGTDETAVLDGFIVRAGSAYGGEVRKQDRGAGMYTVTGQPTVMNSTFSGNRALFGGAGMYNEQSSPTVSRCMFRMNATGLGGGMCNIKSSPIVTDCTFSSNYTRDGGGMYNEGSSPVVAGCTFSNNSAWVGGGMWNRGGGTLMLTDCTFSGNTALYYGGGIDTDSSESLGMVVAIKSSIIEGNLANLGGGMCCGRGLVTIEDSVIRDNRASWGPAGHTGKGGGICCGYGSITIKGSVIARNQAREIGGGIYSFASELVLVNNVITANEAITLYYPGYGGAISCSGSVTLINTTMVGNRARGYTGPRGPAPGEGGGIRWGGGTKFVMANCLVRDNRPDQVEASDDPAVQIAYSNIEGGWAGVGNIDADPCFAEPSYWGDANDPNIVVDPNDPNALWVDGEYHLKSQAGRWDANEGRWTIDDLTSPCIDAGDPMTPIGYEPFPNGGRINMGAYGGTAEASKSYFGGPPCETIVPGDVNGDCKVNFLDFQLMALHWLEER